MYSWAVAMAREDHSSSSRRVLAGVWRRSLDNIHVAALAVTGARQGLHRGSRSLTPQRRDMVDRACYLGSALPLSFPATAVPGELCFA